MVICHHCGTKSLSMSTVSYKSNLRGQYLNRKSYHHISLKFRKFLSLWVSVCLYFLQHYQWKKDVGSKTVIVPLFVHLIIALVTKILWQGFHFFFYLGFLSQPFANHRTAGERGGHFFNFLLPLPLPLLLHRHLDISQVIIAKTSPLHTVAARLELETFGFRAQVPNHEATCFIIWGSYSTRMYLRKQYVSLWKFLWGQISRI